MSCSCIKGNFDFVLTSLDCETLIFKDLSDWQETDNYTVPSTYEVEITLPNKNAVTLNFAPREVTKITSDDLGGGNCLQDGIYCFTVKGCKNAHGEYGSEIYTRYGAVICSLECKIDFLLSQAKNEKDFESVNRLRSFTDSIKINTRMNKPQKAIQMFTTTTKELNNLNCNC